MDNSFTKAERLNSKKDINNLFDNGEKLFSYPYRVFWQFVDADQQQVPSSILISVSKRGFKKAVDRNQIKRYIRESYRTQKSIIVESLKGKKIQLGILYIEKETKDFHFHEKAIKKLLTKLSEVLQDT
jgi:ribonuclease P protein component